MGHLWWLFKQRFFPYPYSMTQWSDPHDRLIRYAISKGFTEADVWRYRRSMISDWYTIQMHNWRKIQVSGYELMTMDVPTGSINVTYHDGLPKASNGNRGWNPTVYVSWTPPPEWAGATFKIPETGATS